MPCLLCQVHAIAIAALQIIPVGIRVSKSENAQCILDLFSHEIVPADANIQTERDGVLFPPPASGAA
jgi:hypothetical protein